MSEQALHPTCTVVRPELSEQGSPFLPPGSSQAGVVLSGIGGWELGLHRAGWDILYSAESDAGKRDILSRHASWPIYETLSAVQCSVRNGLYIVGGLPSHECEGELWKSCVQGIYQSEARWVIVETVHTVLGHTVWPGAMGRLQHDLHNLGYTTLWIGTAFGNKFPTVRWIRLMMIGFPMGWGIPTALSALHSQVVLVNDLEVAAKASYLLMHADQHPHQWMTCMGYTEDWMNEHDDRNTYLSVTSCPMVTEVVGGIIMKADKELTLTVGDSAEFKLRRE